MLVSNVGTWMQRVAQDWLVLVTLDGGPAALGITTGLQFLPFLVVAPFGGALADRLPKRHLLMFTNGFMGLVALILGVLVVTDMAQVWHVYVLAFLLGAGGALDNPARNTFVAELVEPDDVPNAVGLNGASFHSARLVGPAVAGLLIAGSGAGSGLRAQRTDVRRADSPAAGHRTGRRRHLRARPHRPATSGRRPVRVRASGSRHGARDHVLRRHIRHELPDDHGSDGDRSVRSGSAGVRFPRLDPRGRIVGWFVARGAAPDAPAPADRGCGRRLRAVGDAGIDVSDVLGVRREPVPAGCRSA